MATDERNEYLGFKSDVKQVRDPRQLSIKYIDKHDIEIKDYNVKTMPSGLLNFLINNRFANGSLADDYENILSLKEEINKGDLESVDDYYILVATYKKKTVGACVFFAEDDHINTFVKLEFRQQGVGRLLINKLREKYPNAENTGSYEDTPIGGYFYGSTTGNKSKEKMDLDYINNLAEERLLQEENQENQKNQHNKNQLELFNYDKK
ncbi:MAG: GNAT family N-acetyltransferase [Bacteroidia bacterium]